MVTIVTLSLGGTFTIFLLSLTALVNVLIRVLCTLPAQTYGGLIALAAFITFNGCCIYVVCSPDYVAKWTLLPILERTLLALVIGTGLNASFH
jgi:hypothetical protein